MDDWLTSMLFFKGVLEMLCSNAKQEDLNQPNKIICLNDIVESKHGPKIVCRDFAYFVYKNGFDCIHSLNSKEAIEKEPMLMDLEYRKNFINLFDSSYSIFHIDDFGETLYQNAKALKMNQQKIYLFYTENHAMCVELQAKEVNSKINYIVKFYDPNCTNVYVKKSLDNINSIKNLNLQNFLVDDAIKLYFPEFSLGMLVSFEKNYFKSPRLPNVKNNKDLAIALRYLIAYSLYSADGAKICQQILSSELSSQEKFELLTANGGGGILFLHRALVRNNVEIVNIFAKEILLSNLSDEHKMDLLTPNQIFIECCKKNTEAPAIFIETLCSLAAANEGQTVSKSLVKMLYNDMLNAIIGLYYLINKNTYGNILHTVIRKRYVDDMLADKSELDRLSEKEYRFIQYHSEWFKDVLAKSKLEESDLKTISRRYKGATRQHDSSNCTFFTKSKNPICAICDELLRNNNVAQSNAVSIPKL